MQYVAQQCIGKAIAHLMFQVIGGCFEVLTVFRRTFPCFFLYLAKFGKLFVRFFQFAALVGKFVKHFL